MGNLPIYFNNGSRKSPRKGDTTNLGVSRKDGYIKKNPDRTKDKPRSTDTVNSLI